MYIYAYIYIYTYTCLIDIEKTEDMCTVRHNMSVDTFYQIVTFAGNIRSSLRMRLPTKKRSGVLSITGPCVGIMYSICIYGVVYFHIYIFTYIVAYICDTCVCVASHLEMSAPRLMSWNVSSTGVFIHFWSPLWLGCPCKRHTTIGLDWIWSGTLLHWGEDWVPPYHQ